MKELIDVSNDKEDVIEKGKDNNLFPEDSINKNEDSKSLDNDLQMEKPLIDINEIIKVKNTGYYKKCIKDLLTNKTLIGFILVYSLYFLSLLFAYFP